AAAAVPALRQALSDGNVSVRRQAAGALTNIGADAVTALPELKRALSDADADVQSRSALALAAIGPKAKDAVPNLGRNLRSSSLEVRLYSAEALSRIATDLDSVADDLATLLQKDKDPLVRQRAVWALGRVENLEGSKAAAALEAVLSETSEEMVIVRYEAARYLAHGLGPKTPDKAIDILVAMLSD